MSKLFRLVGFIGAAGVSAALVGTAATGTGAYFSDSRGGTISGKFGTIQIEGTGDGHQIAPISFDKMLPGETQSKTVEFTNTGDSTQDVYAVFDAKDLHDTKKTVTTIDDTGINTAGRYAAVKITSSGGALFESANLNDNAGPECSKTPGHTETSGVFAGEIIPPLCPLPEVVKLVGGLAPTQVGSMTFAFTPSWAFGQTNQDAQGVTGLTLPYKIVAVQEGKTPGQLTK